MAIYVYTDEFIREPWENTVAYYPLTSTTTVNDMSSKQNNLTSNWTIQYWDYGDVDCCFIDWHGMLYTGITSITASSWITLNVRYRETNNPTWDCSTILAFNPYDPTTRWNRLNSMCRLNWAYSIWYWLIWFIDDWKSWWTYSYTSPVYTFTQNQRYNICYTYEWNSMKFYVNWVLEWTATRTTQDNTLSYISISRNVDVNSSIRWYLSKAIFESKARTSQEISDYFNGTKSLYGIS